METIEAEISTPTTDVQNVDTSNSETPIDNIDTVSNEPTEQEEVAENEQQENLAEKLYAGKYKTVEELEKGYKESEKSVNRVAELEKELETLRTQVPQQPQVVNEQGQVNPQFEQQFNLQVDDYEFRSYQQLASYLNEDDMPQAIKALNEAKQHYLMGDKKSYETLMAEVKEFFNPVYVEQIAEQKAIMKAQKGQFINQAMLEKRRQAEIELETEMSKNSEIWNIVNPESDTHSQNVYRVMNDVFNAYGRVDSEVFANAIKDIKALGVKEYIANLDAQKTAEMNKQKANISTGENIAISSVDKNDVNSKEFWNEFYKQKKG